MNFKDWLIKEEDAGGGDEGSNWFYGNSLYPSDAGDWHYDASNPHNFSFLGARWKKERDDWGRKFHSLDPNTTIKHKFTSIHSKTMPDTSDQGWKHSSKKRDDVEIDKNAQVIVIGGENKKSAIPVFNKANKSIDRTDELNQKFGKFKPSMWQLPVNFDEPWSPYTGSTKMKYAKKKIYKSNMNNFS
jgi:hypothetical protein